MIAVDCIPYDESDEILDKLISMITNDVNRDNETLISDLNLSNFFLKKCACVKRKFFLLLCIASPVSVENMKYR